MRIAIKYEVPADGVKDAYYSMQNATEQIKNHVENINRTAISQITHEELFASKSVIAEAIRQDLSSTLAKQGYHIIEVQFLDVNLPEDMVKNMNRKTQAERLREVELIETETKRLITLQKLHVDNEIAIKKTEADNELKKRQLEVDASLKMKQLELDNTLAAQKADAQNAILLKNSETAAAVAVREATSEVEVRRLLGEGTAAQRKAVLKGLEDGVNSMQAHITPEQTLHYALTSQYFDMMKEVGTSSTNSTLFVPNNPTTLQDQVRQGMMEVKALKMEK
jgi:regulator of protease activity HflC (stomatin/prohibitin superfamily)